MKRREHIGLAVASAFGGSVISLASSQPSVDGCLVCEFAQIEQVHGLSIDHAE